MKPSAFRYESRSTTRRAWSRPLFDMKAARRKEGLRGVLLYIYIGRKSPCIFCRKMILRKRLTDPPQCDTLMPIVNRNDLPPGKQRWILHRQALADARSRRYFFVRIYHTPAPPVKPTANGGIFRFIPDIVLYKSTKFGVYHAKQHHKQQK